uniref:Uncharacterized protein n=1 Tax=Nostoc flagelliforme str. Sunitezuoqi TaxID=676037 RepID=E7DPV9_9NOSO|nr:hypothetical protein Nfla_4901 [Nostoc flagelliforme str. Sunitezuoqi]
MNPQETSDLLAALMRQEERTLAVNRFNQ